MKKLLIAGILFYTFTLTSCGEFFPSDGKFEVSSIQEGYSSTKYHLTSTKGNNHFWLKDSVGKYHVGDVLILTKLNERKE